MSSKGITPFTIVEHPAVVKNVDRALETLGGHDAILEAFSGAKALEFRYRPQNLYQSAMTAERTTMDDAAGGIMHVVFRLRRKKRVPNSCTVECLGLVQTVHSFKSLCDFQYLPIRPHSSGEEGVYEDLVPRLVPTTFQSAFSWWKRPEPNGEKVPRFLPPFVFSRYNNGITPRILTHDADRVVEGSYGQNMRVERKAWTLTVQANDEFPDAPSESAVKDVDLRIRNEEAHKLVKDLFEERPMWNRVAIHCKTGLDDTILKVLLAKYGFYILSGPWGRLWCKFGYDPRKDPNAKRFQTIMVSFRKHQSIPERQRLRLGQGDRNATVSVTPVYQYTAGLLPVIRQMWYCVCDIRLPAAQRLLRSDFYGTLPEYNPTTGWLPAETIKAIRNAIKEDVRNTSNTLETEDGSDAEEDALTERQSEDESGDLLNAMEWEDE